MNTEGISIAHHWLKAQFEECHGHISSWSCITMDQYHTNLGLLIDFVTDCWPEKTVNMKAMKKKPNLPLDPVIRRVLQCKHYWVEYNGNTSANKEYAFAEAYCARCGVIRRNKDEAQILL